jgi:hypothetical protein
MHSPAVLDIRHEYAENSSSPTGGPVAGAGVVLDCCTPLTSTPPSPMFTFVSGHIRSSELVPVQLH